MTDTTNVNTSYIENSSCFRFINKDEYLCGRIVLTGLTYNIDELCRVVNILLNEKDIDEINRNRRCKINFQNRKITDKQIEHIRDSNNGLHQSLINIIYERIGIKKGGKDYDRFNEFSNKLLLKIIIYDIDKNILFETEKGMYIINVLKNNEQYYAISNIDRFKPNSNEIYAGKKKKIQDKEIPIENINNTVKTLDEQVAILKRLKSKPFSDDVVKELISSVSLDVFLNYKDDDDFDPDRVKEWEYAISCSTCHTGDCFKCDGYRGFKSNVKLFTKKHRCRKYNGIQLVSQCTRCNMYIFASFNHICRNNRKAKRYSCLDNKYSIYINERIDQISDHTIN